MKILEGVSNLEQLKGELHDELEKGTSLYDIVASPGVVKRLLVKMMKAHGSNGVLQFSNYLESLDESLRSVLLDPHPSGRYAANLSFLVPKSFWEAYPHYFSYAGKSFDSHDSAIFFSQPKNALKFFHYASEGRVELESLSPSFVLMSGLASTVYLSEPESRKVLSKLKASFATRDIQTQLANLAITRRLNNRPQLQPESFGGKTAVILSGQMRGMDTALPDLISKLDLPDYDIFVSTWSREGRTSIDRARVRRVFEPDAVPIAASLSARELRSVDREFARAANTSSTQMLDRICGLSDKIKADRVLIADEDEPVFKTMSNSAKMHYHNMAWPAKMGANYFSQNYDYVIKARPDIKLGKVERALDLRTLRELKANEVGNDHPTWLLKTWGFGVGDQLFFGRADVMEQLLNIWPPESISSRIQTALWGKKQPTQGHINLGLEMWMLGYNPKPMPLKKLGLASFDRITKEQLENVLNKIETD